MPFDIAVPREQLVEGFKAFIKLSRRKVLDDALMVASRGCWKVTCSNVSVRLQATGIWSGEVRASGRAIVAVAKAPPVGDTVKVVVRDGRLWLGTTNLSCACVESPGPVSDFVLAAAGQYGPVQRAEDAVLRKATKLLEPFGVTYADVRGLVDAARVCGTGREFAVHHELDRDKQKIGK